MLKSLFALLLPALTFAAPVETTVFESGTDGYHTYRIPGIVVTKSGTLLAFCEGRKNSGSDAGDIDLLVKRSSDQGQTWSKQEIVFEEGGDAKITIGNPCPVVDQSTGTIWMPFCRDNDGVFMTHSDDDGKTWSSPEEITAAVKKPAWGWYATGPGHGIQLQHGEHKGRLVIPCDFRLDGTPRVGKYRYSHTIYSDDHGKIWELGGNTTNFMNECEVVERVDGTLLLSMRNYLGKNQRAFSTSIDGGISWTDPILHDDVFCPTCQSSIERYSTEPQNIILYSGPGGPGRNNLTIRMSRDEGKTWPVAKVWHKGPSAYSDLVVLPDGTFGCLYEAGEDRGYETIRFVRFEMDWLTAE